MNCIEQVEAGLLERAPNIATATKLVLVSELPQRSTSGLRSIIARDRVAPFSHHSGGKAGRRVISTGALRYNFQVGAQHAFLTGTQNAVYVTLAIGGGKYSNSKSGATSVTAQIYH